MPIHQHPPPAASPRWSWKRYTSLGLAMLTCPCHLPLLLGALAGTALGGWLSQYTPAVFLAMLGVFIVALLYGLSASDRRRAGAETLPSHARQTEARR